MIVNNPEMQNFNKALMLIISNNTLTSIKNAAFHDKEEIRAATNIKTLDELESSNEASVLPSKLRGNEKSIDTNVYNIGLCKNQGEEDVHNKKMVAKQEVSKKKKKKKIPRLNTNEKLETHKEDR